MKVEEVTGILQSIAEELVEELEMTPVEVKSSIITQPGSNVPGEFKGSIKEKIILGGTLCRFRAGVNQHGEIMVVEFTALAYTLTNIDLGAILTRHFGNNYSLKHRLM